MSTEEIKGEFEPREEPNELTGLRNFSGTPTEFWGVFLSVSSRLVDARSGVMIVRKQLANGEHQLTKISEWPPEATKDSVTAKFAKSWAHIAGSCAQDGFLLQRLGQETNGEISDFAIAVQLRTLDSKAVCIGAYALADVCRGYAEEALTRIQLAADVPFSYQMSQAVLDAQNDASKLAMVMDIVAETASATSFLNISMVLCNAVATRFNCDRVSLGWLEGGFVRLKAISRTEKFDRHMEAARNLEVAMEECLDQDDEIIWPTPAESTVVNRDHESFVRQQTVDCMCSVPIHDPEGPVAVLTCERSKEPFIQLEVQQLRLVCDFTARTLTDTKLSDRWFGARLATRSRRLASWFVGPEKTWAKVICLLVAAVMACLVFLKIDYRVEAEFIIRSEKTAYLTAPYAGFIASVAAKPGDLVKSGEILLELSKDDLHLQEAQSMAELARYQREAEKARAANQLADMRVSNAQAKQAEARLKLVQHRIALAAIKAPFDGVVVEGDPRQRIGAALSAGDSLFRIARIDSLYIEAEVPERDIHEIVQGQTGEAAFVSRPEHKIPVRVSMIESAAVAKDAGNVFLIRSDFTDGPQGWWRPGMSGLCKVDAGKRRLIWILTHRTVDFFRLWLWW